MVQLKDLIWPPVIKHSIRASVASEITFRLPEETSYELDLSLGTNDEDYEETQSSSQIKMCFISVLTDCVDKLFMLRNVYASVVEKFEVINCDYRTLEERFGHSPSNYADYRINVTYTDMHKLQKDVATIIFLLETLMDEVNDQGTFATITRYSINLMRMCHDEDDLMQDLAEKRKLLAYIRFSHYTEKISNVGVINAFNNSMKQASRAYQEESEYAKAQVKFVKKWEGARFEQNHMKLTMKELGYLNTTESMRWQINLEQHCHQGISTYILESQSDYMEEIQLWMDRYETELENKESEIYNLKMDTERLTDKHELLKMEYEDRNREMEEWLEYKRLKKEEEERIALQNWAAAKIQAWWRAVMFRKKLGPYRKRRGRRGKSKKGKLRQAQGKPRRK